MFLIGIGLVSDTSELLFYICIYTIWYFIIEIIKWFCKNFITGIKYLMYLILIQYQLKTCLIIHLYFIEGEHLHRLCLMRNPIGYCIYAFIQ
jgi:hypothetical protein